jgi:hypothetical protein
MWTAVSGELSAVLPRVVAKDQVGGCKYAATWHNSIVHRDFGQFCTTSYSKNVLDSTVSAKWAQLVAKTGQVQSRCIY